MQEQLIFETQHWKIILSDKQVYLGRSVIICKNDRNNLPALSLEEWDDLKQVIDRFEAGCKKAFGATMFNWSCLMNNAYQNTPPNPQVHWHVKPRYTEPVDFNGHTFTDPNFGHHYDRDLEAQSEPVNQELAGKIAEALRKNI